MTIRNLGNERPSDRCSAQSRGPEQTPPLNGTNQRLRKTMLIKRNAETSRTPEPVLFCAEQYPLAARPHRYTTNTPEHFRRIVLRSAKTVGIATLGTDVAVPPPNNRNNIA